MILNYVPARKRSDKTVQGKSQCGLRRRFLSTGPSSYCGLPGVVLAVDINNGDQTITATSVNTDTVDVSKIVKPKDGKKVTQEEFDKIRDEKMKEMGVEPGSGNNVIIRISNHH